MSRLVGFVLLVLIALLSLAPTVAQESGDRYADAPKSRGLDGAFVLGNPEAAVKLIEFSDYLCASCQNYEPIIRGFIQNQVLTGRAQYEYRIYPVIDPDLSVRSASLVECADALRPGQFWRARDLMFELVSTRGFTDESVADFADSLSLDSTALEECAETANQHAIDAAYGLSLGADATPSLYLQFGDSEPVAIALALPEHHDSMVNAIRPETTEPVLIEDGRYAGVKTFRRADGGFVLGEPAAPITIVAFEDFLCPHCQSYQPNVDAFIDEYVRTGAAQFEFRLYPVVNPQYSTAMVKTAECVAAQDLRRFWDGHDLLFELAQRGSLDYASEEAARLLNLDGERLQNCAERSIQFLIDTRLGQRAYVGGTPAVRARRNGGALEFIYLGEQPIERGAPTIFQLRALMKGDGGVSIGPPRRSLLNDRFLADKSLISGEPCAPPCWQNIVPGETRLAEALVIVRNRAGVTLLSQAEVAFQFGMTDGPPCCQISADERGIVNAIILQYAPAMTISQAVDVYGEPLFFRGQPYTESEALLWFYFPALATMIQTVAPGVDGALQPDSPIVAAYYLSANELPASFAEDAFRPWQGYVAYRDYVEG